MKGNFFPPFAVPPPPKSKEQKVKELAAEILLNQSKVADIIGLSPQYVACKCKELAIAILEV